MNAALVKVDVAAARLGWTGIKVLSLVEGGTLLEGGFEWVWNLANNLGGDRRDLRIWSAEVESKLDGQSLPQTQLAEVLESILPPTRNNFHAGEVDAMFQIRPRTRIDYGTELNGGVVSGRTLYPRATLAAFLERRWINKKVVPISV